MKHIIVGTAGHIDHGKTSLVKALTGVNADRLKEEQERGITIDIGFADLVVADWQFGFVDVPGHERFVKNMLAGAHGIDLVMLVIAADEGVMPQTREHFDICKLLQIKAGLTVLTKIDLVDEDLRELAAAEIAEFTQGSFLETAPIIGVSTKTGAGIDQLQTALTKLAAQLPTKDPRAVPRLPIDRAFIIKGFGTVVTGTLTAGQFHLGEEVEILPSGRRSRIRGLQVHGQTTEQASAGQRTAINLQGISLEDATRGQTLVPAARFRTSSLLDVTIEILPNAARPLTQRTRIRLHHNTAEIMARVIILGQTEIAPGERAIAQLRLEAPIFALPGDRFILRSYSPQITIGGGQIINSLPVKHRWRDADALTQCQHLAQAQSDASEYVATLIENYGINGITLKDLAATTNLLLADLSVAVTSGIANGRLLSYENQYLAQTAYQELKTSVIRLLQNFHNREPLQPGMSREELREKIFSRLGVEIFKLVIEQLSRENLVRGEKDLLRLASHQITLSDQDTSLYQQLEARFKTAGFQALTYEEGSQPLAADSQKLRKLYQLLLQQQRLIKIGDFIFHREIIDNLLVRLRQEKTNTPKLDIAKFKEITGLSRKHAIPLLEYLDLHRITRRVGNDREIL